MVAISSLQIPGRGNDHLLRANYFLSLSQLFGFNSALSFSIPFLSSTVMLSFFFHICFDSFLPLKHLSPFSLGCRVVILKSYTRECVRLVGSGRGVCFSLFFLPRSEGSHSCQDQTLHPTLEFSSF